MDSKPDPFCEICCDAHPEITNMWICQNCEDVLGEHMAEHPHDHDLHICGGFVKLELKQDSL